MPSRLSDGKLSPREEYWRDRYDFLHKAGYTLRPRYKPGWTPSWKGTNKRVLSCEDSITAKSSGRVMDAVRTVDGKKVMLKKASTSTHPHEVEIGRLLSSPELSADPLNHCCPILDVLQDPEDANVQFIVMPLLRRYKEPRFETVGEAIEFFRQVVEGLQFMHLHHVAHRDCMTLNIMMDPSAMFPKMYHPQANFMKQDLSGYAKYYSRTARPTRYYLTDFGLSRVYNADDSNPLEVPILGGDKSVPEFQEDPTIPRNPFHTDVYYLGNVIKEDFLDVYSNFGFMDSLVAKMMAKEPEKRPTMDQVVSYLTEIISKLPIWQPRARLVTRKDGVFMNLVKGTYHVSCRTVPHILRFRPSIPTPKAQP